MNIKNGIRLFLGFYFVAFFLGCAASKPNTPYKGPYPTSFEKLSVRNPLLVQEIGKLPELQDGISDQENNALEQLVTLYEMYPDKFDDAFNEMYKIGLPDHRKYCSPIQALFWLAEDNNLNDEHITKYSLSMLLYHAWQEKPPDDKVLQVIKGIKEEKMQNQFLQYIQNGVDEATINTIFLNYKSRPNMFSWSARKIIRTGLSSDPRWGDVDTIVDRLNAPELLDFYINKNITYKHVIPGFHRSPRSVINEKYGDCDDLAYFGRTVLSKAGYDLFGRHLNKGARPDHIGLGIRLEDGSYLLAVDFDQSGNHMSGPYKTLLEFDQALGYGTRYQKRDPFFFDW